MSRPRILFLSCIGIVVALTAMLYGNLFRRPSLTSVLPKSMSTAARPVIVVGSGLAGLSASYEAIQRGATVHLLDRAPKPGGNSVKASSGINGEGTRFQKAHKIETDGLFYADTVKSGGSRFSSAEPPVVDREALVSKLVSDSAAAVTWLADEIGVDLSLIAPLGGHSVARTHRGAGKTPPGAAIVFGLLGKLKENGRFTMSNGAEVKSLVSEAGAVTGVEYVKDGATHRLQGPVVFASGGFAGDATGLLAKHRPDLEGIPSTNEERPGAHGILSAVGAELVDMDSVQIHPTGFVDPASPNTMLKFLAAEVLRGEGGILLSSEGQRFVNELETRDHVSEAIMRLPQSTDGDGLIHQWDTTLLLDPGAAEAAGSHVGFYEWKGLVKRVKVKHLDPAVIASVDKYAQAVADAAADPFGRRTYGRWTLKPGAENREQHVVVGRVTPIVHFTMGGAAMDTDARVLRNIDGKIEPIPGIWAAGEITGGVHGDNRLGGSSLLECVVFGRVAGAGAAAAAAS